MDTARNPFSPLVTLETINRAVQKRGKAASRHLLPTQTQGHETQELRLALLCFNSYPPFLLDPQINVGPRE